MPPEPRKSKIPAMMKSIPSTKVASTGETRRFEENSAKFTAYVTPASVAEEPSKNATLRKMLLFMAFRTGLVSLPVKAFSANNQAMLPSGYSIFIERYSTTLKKALGH